jgi:tetratricopeptide (TPR) repeat protein
MEEFVFDELSSAYLEKAGLSDTLAGVSIPLKEDDLRAFLADGNVDISLASGNMVRVLGIDPQFAYANSYVKCILKVFGDKTLGILNQGAVSLANRKEFEEACIYFRAALAIEKENLDAMYGYIRVLGDLYNNSTDEDYVGNFKAECLEYLERIIDVYPHFSQGWYLLGYMYLNLGLYIKAQLAWERFVIEADDGFDEDKREIAKRMKQIAVPIEIEKGYNAVLSGKWDDGILLLEKHRNGEYDDWWPLWYYLGVAYVNTDRVAEAEEAFKEALRGNPRHTQSMLALIDIYDEAGEEELVQKYLSKIDLIRYDLENKN